MTTAADPLSADELLDHLAGLGIDTRTVEHPPVFTVEDAKEQRGILPGAHTKSLFLRNKKGAMWLLVVLEDRRLDLKAVGDRLAAGRLSFGSPDRLMRYLGVIPGAVSPFGVINDVDRSVRVVLDRTMLEIEPLNFHPLDNARTTAISAEGLMRFLASTGHNPQILDFS
jgi:Ala-tRNA(Pro) deacylase